MGAVNIGGLIIEARGGDVHITTVGSDTTVILNPEVARAAAAQVIEAASEAKTTHAELEEVWSWA